MPDPGSSPGQALMRDFAAAGMTSCEVSPLIKLTTSQSAATLVGEEKKALR